ncbi:MAG: Lrp/AsnC family transcriptional regulator [Aestuariivirga sp.]|uniref:Lrp/AsnC family transcriptional regulator n=1 Tax=Aestuariivirga sp. TaxID=2650926 RepID=UPI0025BEB96F|nr:Lrp/AsnC family transcriptional regulator [Aestuariivirga sp.]MCA3561734.1 Lrp/AsnC family transcriptional regulator [Aestuariivirga sp.]
MQDEPAPIRPFRLNANDRAILALLEEDAKRTTTEIASILGISRTTVKNRIDRMRDHGVIKRYTIELENPSAEEGRPSTAFFVVQLKRPICRIVYQSIRGWPELLQAWSVTGETDFLVLVRTTDSERIEHLRERLIRHPEVRNVTRQLVLQDWVRRVQPSADSMVAP